MKQYLERYFRHLYKNLFIWRWRHVSDMQLLYVLSVVVGLVCGIAAVLLKNTVHYTYLFITDVSWFSINTGNWLFLAYPMIGIILTTLFVKHIIRTDIGHGVSNVLYAISRKNGYLAPHHCYSSILASSITVAFGGSVGLEAPTVLTGSAIGSNIGRVFRLEYKHIITLIGCGAAGALSAVFKAPIGGILFVFEVLLLDLTMSTALPLLLSSVTGFFVSFMFFGGDVQFEFTTLAPFALRKVPFYMLLGVAAALTSSYFLRVNAWISKRMATQSTIKKILISGVGLGILVFLFPPLFGEGYAALNHLLNGRTIDVLENSFFYNFKGSPAGIVLVLFGILIFKVFATSLTTSGGGVGGVFAPSFFLGGFLGFLIAHTVNLFGFNFVDPTNFTLLGMAAVMTGIMHSPLTATFLIAEITAGYGMFIPLLTTCSIAYMVSKPLTKYSIYAYDLACKGQLVTHDKDKTALAFIDKKKIIERNFITLTTGSTLKEMVNAVEQSSRNLFPVLDDEGYFLGVVTLNDLRPVMFHPENYYKYTALNLMRYSEEFIVDVKDSMDSIVHKFKGSDSYNVIVVDDGKYMGVMSRANVYATYRTYVQKTSEE